MLGHDVSVMQKFLYDQPPCHSASTQNTQHSQGAKEVQRARQIAQQKADRDQIKKYAEGARDSIMRSASLAIDISNRHFNNRRSIPRRQRRNEAVQFPVERYLFQHLAAISLESRSKVMNADTTEFSHQPVGAAGRNAAQPKIVDAALPPSAHDVVAFGNLLEE